MQFCMNIHLLHYYTRVKFENILCVSSKAISRFVAVAGCSKAV